MLAEITPRLNSSIAHWELEIRKVSAGIEQAPQVCFDDAIEAPMMFCERQSGRSVCLPETAAHAILATMHKPVRPFRPTWASMLITLTYPPSGQHATALPCSDQQASHIDSGGTRHTKYCEGILYVRYSYRI
jgi:hypothetical protein